MTEKDLQNRPVGYARVSTYGQTLDVQLEQMKAVGCERVCRAKMTGVRADPRELLKMLKAVAPGDVGTVTRIDRSTFDLFGIVKRIVDGGGQFRSLAEAWADTGSSTGRLMIAVFGGLADVECDLIRTRSAEAHPAAAEGGTAAAAAAGRRCHAQGTGQELQCYAGDNCEAGGGTATDGMVE